MSIRTKVQIRLMFEGELIYTFTIFNQISLWNTYYQYTFWQEQEQAVIDEIAAFEAELAAELGE